MSGWWDSDPRLTTWEAVALPLRYTRNECNYTMPGWFGQMASRARSNPKRNRCFTAEVAESAEESAVPNVVGFLTTKTQVGGVGEEGMEGLGPDVREHWHEIGGGKELTGGAERVIL